MNTHSSPNCTINGRPNYPADTEFTALSRIVPSVQLPNTKNEGFGVERIAHTGVTDMDAMSPGKLLVVDIVQATRCAIHVERRSVIAESGDLVLIGTPHSFRIHSEDAILDVVSLDVDRFQRVAFHTGRGRAAAHCGVIRAESEERARHWRATLRYIRHEILGNNEIAEQRLWIRQAFRLLVAATISDFPLEPHGRDLPMSVCRAIDYMSANSNRNIDLNTIAEAVGVSARQLQNQFRKYCASSPMTYLRDLQLAGAHHDLVHGDLARGDTVGAIATRWGFHHHGRFAVAYRRRYGATPRVTLMS